MSAGRCKFCEKLMKCPVCGISVENFDHIGVRGSGLKTSSIWHYARPCGHRVDVEAGTEASSTASKGELAKYNGGPLWKDGYKWINIFWGSFWQGNSWVDRLDKAVEDIEKNNSYSGELSQYNIGIGELAGHKVITKNPPPSVSSQDIGKAIAAWIQDSTVPDIGTKGAYNVFLPPGVTALLGTDRSCVQFCDYHDTAGGDRGPFFTCEPYPCGSGCNQCNSSEFDTITQGLSEEMVELKTDMNPGTGWVIGNEEICDYCDAHFVCNRISSGEYVNAWYSDLKGACWSPGP